MGDSCCTSCCPIGRKEALSNRFVLLVPEEKQKKEAEVEKPKTAKATCLELFVKSLAVGAWSIPGTLLRLLLLNHELAPWINNVGVGGMPASIVTNVVGTFILGFL